MSNESLTIVILLVAGVLLALYFMRRRTRLRKPKL
jgi:uncharacterized membrane protein affecting hemolysin expression